MASGNVSPLLYPYTFPDQLRFNSNISPDPVNMATRFKLKPTPVILHKLNKHTSVSSHHDNGGQPLLSFETRMELASRLAKRELESNLSLSETSLDHHSACMPHSPVTMATTATMATTRPSGITTTTRKPRTTINTRRCPQTNEPSESQSVTMATRENTRPRTVSFNEPKMSGHRSVVMTTGEDSGIEINESEEIERISSDVRKLREELTLKLRILPLSSSSYTVTEKETTKEDTSSRSEWIKDIDKEKRREVKRNEEQTTRNARLLYQLQQKIKGAQRAISKTSSGSQLTKKNFHAIQQLASAHRTAIRTLSSLTNTPTNPKITQELISLLELLSRISSQCNLSYDHEEEGQLMSVIQELKHALNEEYLRSEEEKKRKQDELERDNRLLRSDSQQVKKRKKLMPKMRSVLLKRSALSKRPHPLVHSTPTQDTTRPHPPNRPHPINDSVPHFARPTHSANNKLRVTPKRGIGETTPTLVDRSLVTPTRKSPHIFTNVLPSDVPSINATPTTTTATRNVASEVTLQRETNRQGLLDTQQEEEEVHSQVNYINTIQRETLIKLNQLHEMVRNMKEHPHPPKAHPQFELPHPQIESHPFDERPQRSKPDKENMPVQHVTTDETTLPVNNTCDTVTAVEGPLYNKMVARLDEIEKEKSEIQQRWKTISYDDPHSLSNPPSHPPSPSHSRPINTCTCTSVPPLDTNRVDTIMKYRNNYINYIKLCGANTEAGFDPWKLIDSICNELMDDMLHEVISELDTALEDCVLELYNEEFHQPS